MTVTHSAQYTLQEIRRAMNENPREMRPEVLAWAISVMEDRLSKIPPLAPARKRYEIRLRILQFVAERSE